MKVRWTGGALAELEDIGAYVSEDDPSAAVRLVERLFEASQVLAEFPRMGRLGKLTGTRELVVSGTQYFLPYRLLGDEVQILAVIHGARRWPPQLGEEDA